MKKFIWLALFFVTSCVRESHNTWCYSYVNDTEHDVALKFYSRRYLPVEEQVFTKTGAGFIHKACDAEMGAAPPAKVMNADSIVIEFNNNRRLIYVNPDGTQPVEDFRHVEIFSTVGYDQEPGTRNYTWRITNEDFEIAEPY